MNLSTQAYLKFTKKMEPSIGSTLKKYKISVFPIYTNTRNLMIQGLKLK